MDSIKKIVILSLFLIFITSCAKYQKLLKSSDINLKLEKAIEFFDNKEYVKAYPLFEELMTFYRGTNKAQEIYYYYAYTLFGTGEYILASYHFKNYTKTFPNSKNTEEAAFMNAYCFYIDSPIYSLDQSNTFDAMDELQLFINQYPNSNKIKECNDYIEELHQKLEKKAFINAILYYKTMSYQGAVIAIDNMLYDYPDTEYREEATYFQVKSYYELAKNSIESKKAQRIKLAKSEYSDFRTKFATSKYIKELDNLYSTIDLEKKKLINK